MRLATLQAGSRGPLVDLRDCRGLVAFLANGDPLWSEYMSALQEAFASRGRHRGPGPVVRTTAGSAQVGTAAFEAFLKPVLAPHELRREEFSAIWFGAGPVSTWLAAAGSLLQGPELTRKIREMGHLRAPGTGVLESAPAKSLAGWARRLTREAAEDVERLTRAQAGADDLEARVRELRAEAAEAQGDVEAGMMAWVRERQDAETRLLLYRDRERELRAQLKGIDEAEEDAVCGSCGHLLGDRAGAVRDSRKEQWEAIVQDGRWWRRRRDQLEFKPDDLKATEGRALALGAEVDDLSEELERRKMQAMELDAAAVRLEHLTGLKSRLSAKSGGMGGPGTPGPTDGATPGEIAENRAALLAASGKRVRARIHGKVVALTGGRLVGVFPRLFSDWTEGGRRGGEEVAVLELAARLVLMEMALDAGVALSSAVFPTGLDRLNGEDLPRALADLVRLARRVPLLLVKVTAHVAAAVPECFDLLYRVEDFSEGQRVRRQRSGLGAIWLQEG